MSASPRAIGQFTEEEIITKFVRLEMSSPDACHALALILGDDKLASRKIHMIRLIQRIGPDEAFRIIGIAADAGLAAKRIWKRERTVASDDYCSKCQKMVLRPGVAYGINPDAICECRKP